MHKSLFILFSFFFCLTLTSHAQVNLNNPIPTDPNVKVGKLSNGLTYYIRQNKKPENKVELRLVVNAGSVLEREDQQGLAHFLEHMAFNGTKNFKKNELVSFLQSIGISFGPDLNAYTSFDETIYILPLPTEKKELIDKGLLILSDWASEITLDPEEIDKERGVILEELRNGNDADLRMLTRLFPKIYPGSPYADRFPVGKKEIIETFNRKSLVDFYETWYRPDLMAVVVVGDIDVSEIEAKIKSQFSAIKAKPEPVKRPNFPIPDNKETIVAIETDKEAQRTSVELTYKKPAMQLKTLADLRQNTLVTFFVRMFNGRLNEISQSPNSPFIGAGAGHVPLFRTKSDFKMLATTNPQGLKPAISALLIENKRAREFGFTKAEFDRQKESFLAQWETIYKEKDKIESSVFVTNYINNFLTGAPISSVEFDHQLIQTVVPAITLEEINALTKNMSTEDNLSIVIKGPSGEEVKYPTEKEILQLLKESETAKVTPYTEKIVSEPLVKELPTTAKISEEKTDNRFGITTWTLSNGVKVILKPTDFQADKITMNAYSPGGLSVVDDEKFKSSMYFDLIANQSGFNRFSVIELDKMLAGKNAGVQIGLGDLFETVSGNSSQKDFETMLQLTYLRFNDMKFDKAVFDSLIGKINIVIPTLKTDPQLYFSQEIREILTQNHPRSLDELDLELVNKTKLQDIEAIYKERFADASDFTFIFVGNFEIESVKPQILKYLGNLPSLKRKENWKDSGIKPPAGKIEKVIKKGIDDKSNVRIIFTGDAIFNINEAHSVSALGELLNIKLFEVLREEKGGVYTPQVSGGLLKIPSGKFVFEINFSCSPANADSLIDAALAEIAKIQSGQIDDKDIDKIKQARLVNTRQNMKENSYWMAVISNQVTHGDEIRTLQEIEARINSINKNDLQKIAQKYLIPENKKQFVLMPETDKK